MMSPSTIWKFLSKFLRRVVNHPVAQTASEFLSLSPVIWKFRILIFGRHYYCFWSWLPSPVPAAAPAAAPAPCPAPAPLPPLPPLPPLLPPLPPLLLPLPPLLPQPVRLLVGLAILVHKHV